MSVDSKYLLKNYYVKTKKKIPKKIKTYLKKILKFFFQILFFPLFLIIILIKPFRHFRFGKITSRYGASCSMIVSFLESRRTENFSKSKVDIIGRDKISPNSQLLIMSKRASVNILPYGWIRDFFRKSLKMLTRNDVFTSPIMNWDIRDLRSYKTTDRPYLKFSKDETKKGEHLISKLGIPSGTKWICIFNRDEAHLNKLYPDTNWDYHSYRDFEPETLVGAAEEFVGRGYYVVRIGSDTKKKLLTNRREIIDYSSSSLRNEFLDVFLSANCETFFGGDSGISTVSKMFGKPVYEVNLSLTQLNRICQIQENLFITKHLFSKDKKRYLTLREIFEYGLMGCASSKKLETLGIKAISNSFEENKEFAKEVLDDINGMRKKDTNVEKLQFLFWSICKEYMSDINFSNVKANIGSAFLKKNTYLLS